MDGIKIAKQTVERPSPWERSGFFDVGHRIPTELVKGKQNVTVRFQATKGNETASAYGIHMIRADGEQ